MSNLITYTFSQVGFFNVSINAWNNISFGSFWVLIEVTNQLTGLQFRASTPLSPPNISCSIAKKQGLFLFLLKTGRLYQCSINFGDQSSILTINDYEFSFNNTFIGKLKAI